MSKESKIKKKIEKAAKQKKYPEQLTARKNLTFEAQAQIVRDRIASRPVIKFRYSNGKLNKQFIFTLVLMIVAFIVALYFLSYHG